MRSYGPTRWLDYYDTHAILCAGYYTSRYILYITLHTTNLKASCQMHFIARSQVHSWLHSIAHSQPAWLYAPNCSRWHTPSLLDLRSQVSSQDAPKYTLSTLPSTPPSTFSRACSPGRSQLHSMAHSPPAGLYAPKQALKMLSSILPSMLWSMFPIACHNTLPTYLALCFQVYSQEARHSQFHLTICSYICFLVFNWETWRVAATRHQEADHE